MFVDLVITSIASYKILERYFAGIECLVATYQSIQFCGTSLMNRARRESDHIATTSRLLGKKRPLEIQILKTLETFCIQTDMLIFLFALPLASGATLRLLDNRWEQSLSADFDLVARQVNQLIAPSDLFTEELPAENPTTDPKVSSRKTDFTKDIREQYALLQRDWTTKIQARWSAADIPSDADSDPEATIARIKTLKAEIHQDVQESIQNWKEFQLKVWIKGIARRWRGFEYQIHARLEKVVRAFGGALYVLICCLSVFIYSFCYQSTLPPGSI